jgi:hypothetical protein
MQRFKMKVANHTDDVAGEIVGNRIAHQAFAQSFFGCAPAKALQSGLVDDGRHLITAAVDTRRRGIRRPTSEV